MYEYFLDGEARNTSYYNMMELSLVNYAVIGSLTSYPRAPQARIKSLPVIA